jgi:hypothetical protein
MRRTLLAFLLCLPSLVSAQPKETQETKRTHILLQGHSESGAKARYVAVSLAAGAKLGKPFEVEGYPLSDNHYVSPAAYGGGAAWAQVESAGKGFQVVLRDMKGGSVASAHVGDKPPAALHSLGKVFVLGQRNKVKWIDFRAAPPTVKTVLERPLPVYKHYDLFARQGDWLVAIDDVVSPIYADTFRVGKKLGLTHEEGLTLPGSINGSYTLAVLTRSKAREGVLYTVVPYHIMSGYGHDLAALKLSNGKAAWSGDDVLQNSRGDPPVLEEHVSGRGQGKADLVSGKAFTHWTGLTALPARKLLLVAAGTRGLLQIPMKFDRNTKGKALKLGARCLDVALLAGRLWVLVGGEDSKPALVELDPVKLSELKRTPLPTIYEKIVR